MSTKRRRFIPGIHNYCDQWCERCPQTRRCRSFALHREMMREGQEESRERRATDPVFWNQVAAQVRAALMGMSSRSGEDNDDDSDPLLASFCEEAFEKYWWNFRDELQQAVAQHPLLQLAQRYKEEAEQTLEAAESDLKSLAVQLVVEAERPFAAAELEEQAYDIEEQLEIINWYVTLIPSKTERAVGNLLGADQPAPDGGDEDEDEEMVEALREVRVHDAEGSAKVVLIGIDRSMAAWLRMREILPGRETAILNTLRTLEQLRRDLLAALPGAEHFRRPGFDFEPDDETADTA